VSLTRCRHRLGMRRRLVEPARAGEMLFACFVGSWLGVGRKSDSHSTLFPALIGARTTRPIAPHTKPASNRRISKKTTRAEPATSSPTPTTDMRVCYYHYRHRLRLENNRNTSINNEVNKRPTFSLRGVQLAFSPFQEHFSMRIMHR
jgi:hypothetical protein